MNDFFNKNSFIERLKLVFSQHNEHRIATMRIICLGYYSITGKIDLAVFRFFSLIFLLGTLCYLFLIGHFEFDKIYFFVPVALITLVYSYADYFLMAMAGLSHITMIFFVTGCLYYLLDKKNVIWAIAFLFFAIFSNGNGFLLIPLGVFGLIIQKNWKFLIYWSAFSVIFLLIYFVNYIKGDLSAGKASIAYVLNVMPYYLGGLGGYSSLLVNKYLGYFAIATILLLLFFKSSYKQNLSLILALGFYVGTYLMISIKRANFGTEMLQREVYFINSILIFTLLYIIFYRLNLKRWYENGYRNLSLISLGIIVLMGLSYQFVNYRIWIHKLFFKQAEINSELISYVGSDVHRFRDYGVYFNTPLVTAHALKPLLDKKVIDYKQSLFCVEAHQKDFGAIGKSNLRAEFEIKGDIIPDNNYLIIQGIIYDYRLPTNVKIGAILSDNKHNQIFINEKSRNARLLIQPSVKGDWYFKFLIKKSDIKIPASQVSIVLADQNQIEKAHFQIPLDLTRKNIISKEIPDFNSTNIILIDSTKNVHLKEVLQVKDEHKFVVNTQNLASSDYSLSFEKEDFPAFELKLSKLDNKDFLAGSFQQNYIKKVLNPGRNLFKLYLIDKKSNIKYPLKSLYFIYV